MIFLAELEASPSESLNLIIIGGYLISLAFAVRVIMRRLTVGVSLAWLAILFTLPYLGAFLYLIFGDIQVGRRRLNHANRLNRPYQEWLRAYAKVEEADPRQLGEFGTSLDRLVRRTVGMPTVPGNSLVLLNDADAVLDEWVERIDAAESYIWMEFYIWSEGGKADAVLEALKRASRRGVDCKVLIDSVGSAPFLRSASCSRARYFGVDIVEAHPAGIIKGLFQRQDIRIHRKIVIIDGKLGYTGSLNLADARFFKQDSGVGHWVDVMVRMEGPGLAILGSVFLKDWLVEKRVRLEEVRDQLPEYKRETRGTIPVQVLPSGPGFFSGAAYQALLTTVFSAKKSILLTTPYFVPDESLNSALASASRRGVEVTLIVPKFNDSYFVKHASRSNFVDLLEHDVTIAEFEGGLLHAKAITIDDELTLIGSVNLDQRSFWINYELTLIVYDPGFTKEVVDLQKGYIRASTLLDLNSWKERPWLDRFHENLVRLSSPLL